MGVTDWEPRALPSEARCKAWAKAGGLWLHSTLGFTRASDRGAIPVDTCAHEFWRPWKDRQPALWSDFYAATHPPIPEGWEKVGEWYNPVLATNAALGIVQNVREHYYCSGDGYAVKVRRILPAIPAGWEAVGEWHDTLSPCSEVYDWTLLADGRIVQRGETFRGKDERIMGVHIRRVLPDVDWGDVPRGVELRPDCAFGGARNEVYVNGVHLGRVFDRTDGVYHTHAPNHEPVAGSPFASLPAAIVALTGRRDE